MKQNFAPNTLEENTKILSNYLPIGKLYTAKGIKESNLYKLMFSFSNEYTRIQSKFNELSIEYDMTQTNELIEEWESALGIPDDCFTNDTDIVTRRLQCQAKFTMMNLQTAGDWIALAALFGYDIEIIHAIDHGSIFPMTFPVVFGSEKQLRFTIIVKFLNLAAPQNTFPMTFPFNFQKPNPIICVFEHLKPVTDEVIYIYSS